MSRAPEDESQSDPGGSVRLPSLTGSARAASGSTPPALALAITAEVPQMIDRRDSPAYAVLRLNPVRSDWLYDSASEL